MNYNVVYSDDYLAHHGILGQKWGVRRYQNEDGSVTPAGARRYYENNGKSSSNVSKEKKTLTDNQKKAIKIGVAVAGTALVAYGGYKLYQLHGAKVAAGKEFINVCKNTPLSSLNKPSSSTISAVKKAVSESTKSTSKVAKAVVPAPKNKVSIQTITKAANAVTTQAPSIAPINKTAVTKATSNVTKVVSKSPSLTLNPGTTVNMKDVLSSASKMSTASASKIADNSGLESYTMDLLKKVSGI